MKIKLRVNNKTRFATADLRKILLAGARRVFDDDDSRILCVDVVECRGKHVYGRAAINGWWSTIKVPKNHLPDMRALGAVIVHEFGHNRGLTHPEMLGALRWTWRGNTFEQWLEFNSWADDFVLREKKTPAKKVAPGPAEKLDRLLAREKAWVSKQKRAQNALKKIARQKRYYEKRVAAMNGGK